MIDSIKNTNLHHAIANPDGYSQAFFDLQCGDISELLKNEPAPRKFLVEGLIPLGVSGLFNGLGGIGKTTFAMQLGASVATGTQFMDHEVQQGEVLMYLSEDDQCEISQRLHRMGEALDDSDKEALGNNLKILPRPATDMPFFEYSPYSRDAAITANFERFFRVAQELKNLRLIVIDSYTRINRLDEIQHSHASFTAAWIDALAQETGATVLLIHHPPKSGSSASRGSSALPNAVRFSASLESAGKKGGQPGDTLHFKLDKFNYGKLKHLNLERLDNGLLAPATINPEEPKEEQFRRLAKCIQDIIVTHTKNSKENGMVKKKLRSMTRLGGEINIQQDRLPEVLDWAVKEKFLIKNGNRYSVPQPKKPTINADNPEKAVNYESI